MKKINIFIVSFITLQLVFTISLFESTSMTSEISSDGLYLSQPNGGETLSGNVTVSWTLALIYRPSVSNYDIFYSPNNGDNWIQIGFTYLETNFLWTTDLYETYGTEYLMKIVASSKEWEDKVEWQLLISTV